MYSRIKCLSGYGFFVLFFLGVPFAGADIQVKQIAGDLSQETISDSLWSGAKEEVVSLMAQPMIQPRPKTTETSQIKVQAIHDTKWIAFRLKWSAQTKAEAGRLGEFSDAAAIQFPVNAGSPPPVFMGAKENPVHIFHWRAQYQRDLEKGKPTMKDLYPNMNPDMYPMEFKDSGSVTDLTQEKREVYSPGQAAGNPQSYSKLSSVDEIFAEGFGSSSVIENRISHAKGQWKNGEWTLVIARPLQRENGSSLEMGKVGNIAFAVWQGGKKEVGSRKSVTMSWVPLQVEKK